MTDKFLVSIIIPCYNPNLLFLEELFNKISRRNENIEILLVDDGSLLSMRSSIKNLCDSNNIYYLSYNENHGVSYARNYGLKHANGQYVMFCDCDDLINIELLNQFTLNNLNEDIYSFASGHLTDLAPNDVQFSVLKLCNNELESYLLCPWLKNIYYSYRGCYSKLFKKSFLLNSKISFNEKLKFCEDTAFVLKAYSNCKSVTFITGPIFYYHRENANSVMHKWHDSYNDFYQAFFDYCENEIDDRKYLLPVYKDTVCIYSKVRICTSFKFRKKKSGLNFIRSNFVKKSCSVLLEEKIKLSKEQKKFCYLITNNKYRKAYNYIIFRRILYRLFKVS